MFTVMSRMALGKSSPAQMVHHSPDLRAELRRICHERRGNTLETGNLRAAKHRFESYQKPLGRSIRLFDSIHQLMVQLAVGTNNVQKKRARQWLEWIAETPRHILLAGMMADAADEASALTRYADSEDSWEEGNTRNTCGKGKENKARKRRGHGRVHVEPAHKFVFVARERPFW